MRSVIRKQKGAGYPKSLTTTFSAGGPTADKLRLLQAHQAVIRRGIAMSAITEDGMQDAAITEGPPRV